MQVIDLRTPYEMSGVTPMQENIAAISSLMQILGQYEAQRRQRRQLETVADIMRGGQTDPAIISQMLMSQGPQYSRGVGGIMQRMASPYMPMGAENQLPQSILGQVLGAQIKQQYAPASTLYGKLPGWWPYASDEEKANYLASRGGEEFGKTPWYMSPDYAKTPEGEMAAGKRPKAARVPSSERQEVNKLEDFAAKLDRIGELRKDEYTGSVWTAKGRKAIVGRVKEATIGDTPEATEFRQLTRELADDLLRLRSGAQINEQEYKRMLSFMPTLDMPAATFMARYDSLKKTIQDKILQRESSLEESGFVNPGEKPIEEKLLDETTALQILTEANGDKNEAREIAKQRGYKF